MNPFHGDGYSFWSGVGNDIPIYVLGVLPLVFTWHRRHRCHVHRCWRLQWHVHPEHGHPVCRKHHPHDARSL